MDLMNRRPARSTIVWLLVGSLTLAAALTVVHSILQATLSERTGLRQQVWQLSERTRDEGTLLVDDIAPAPDLDFLPGNAELPRRFFRATWSGYWYLPEAQEIDVHGSADDRLEVWIDDRLVVQYEVPSDVHTDVQSVALGPGLHALRVEYEQYGGTGTMRVRRASNGGPARVFDSRRLFPERPDAGDLFLSSSVVRLGKVVLLVWLAPIFLIALLVRTRLQSARTDSREANPAILPLQRRDTVLLVSLCAGLFVYGVGNLSVQYANDDGYENLTLGLRLVDTGEYGLAGRDDAFREPLVPASLGVMDRTREWIGFKPARRDCLGENLPPCPSSYAPLKIVNLAFLLVGAVMAFVLVRQLGGGTWLACGAFLLTAQNGQLLISVDRFYTEPHSAALLILTAFFAFRMYHRRRLTDGVWLGLTLAALVLTKVAFVYLWIFIALAFVALDAIDRRVDRWTALLVTVFLVSHFIPVGAWMARNQSAIGSFTVVEGRQSIVLATREQYHDMRDDEFSAAFWYYLPVTKHRPGDDGATPTSIERVYPFNPNSFSQSGNTLSRSADDILYGLLAEPSRHLRTSLLLAWRGVFLARSIAGPSPPDRDIGYTRTGFQRLAEQWELPSWPRWGVPFNALFSTIHHLAGFLSLLVVPAWFWLARRRPDVVLIALPALYCHGVYAVATQFIPRFADTETPLRSVAVMLLVFLVASWARERQPAVAPSLSDGRRG